MRRRNFLATAFSPFVANGASAWAALAGPQAAHPGEGIRLRDIYIEGNRNDSAESVATAELRDFLRRISSSDSESGAAEESSHDRAPVHFLVGRTPAVEQLISAGKIADPAKKNPEAYIVRALEDGGKTKVVFLGGTGIATLYAVYHYLEKYCGCGFYWDGDHVPRRAIIPAKGVERRRRSPTSASGCSLISRSTGTPRPGGNGRIGSSTSTGR